MNEMRIDVKCGLCLCALGVLTRPSHTIVSSLAPNISPVAGQGVAMDSGASVPPFSAGEDQKQQVSPPVSQGPTRWVRATAASDKLRGELLGNGTESGVMLPTSPLTPRLTPQAGLIPTVGRPLTSTVSVLPARPSHISTQESNTQDTATALARKLSTSTPAFTTPSRYATPAQPSTEPRAAVVTPGCTQAPSTSPASRGPVGETHQGVPSELNVGDDDVFKGLHHHVNSPLDPLLAGLVSALIVTIAIISVVVFLKFRQQTDSPEFHRLQDLPMDDLMEDTPLSRYAY